MLFRVATVLPGRYDALMALSTVAAIMGQAQAQTASSWELTPVILAFVLPIVGLTVTLMRYQHVDSTKTRDLIERTNRETREWATDLIERTNRETREWATEQFERTNRETARQFDLLRADIRDIGTSLNGINTSLNDARERLARIEGRLDATHPRPDGNDGEDKRDAA